MGLLLQIDGIYMKQKHPFKDKLFIFIGYPIRSTRQEARDELFAVGGILNDSMTTFVSYIVAFKGAEKTVKYQKALKLQQQGFSVIINEEQFFDILEGKADAPEIPEADKNITIIPADNPEAYTREHEKNMKEIINRKKLKNLAEYGVFTEDGRMKVDLRPFDMTMRITKSFSE